jgi:hypothetical protein
MALRFHRGAGRWQGRHVSYEGFDFNPAGIARCAVGPELRYAVSDVTRNALEFAQLIAPSDTTGYQNGFRSGVEIIPDFPNRQGGDPPMARWGGHVQNISSAAIVVEVGAQKTRPYRVLGRTLEWLELVADD